MKRLDVDQATANRLASGMGMAGVKARASTFTVRPPLFSPLLPGPALPCSSSLCHLLRALLTAFVLHRTPPLGEKPLPPPPATPAFPKTNSSTSSSPTSPPHRTGPSALSTTTSNSRRSTSRRSSERSRRSFLKDLMLRCTRSSLSTRGQCRVEGSRQQERRDRDRDWRV